MKSLKQYLNEALVNKRVYATGYVHTLFPKTKGELKQMIVDEMDKNGVNCSLNHIDVSEITDMSELFNMVGIKVGDVYLYPGNFNGDISNWDVSRVTKMDRMFMGSRYTGENGDISDWDVSKVTNMKEMFEYSKFNGDLSKWDTKNVKYFDGMFQDSNFNGDISNWNMSKATSVTFMFAGSKFNGDLSKWDMSKLKLSTGAFYKSPLENNKPSWAK